MVLLFFFSVFLMPRFIYLPTYLPINRCCSKEGKDTGP